MEKTQEFIVEAEREADPRIEIAIERTVLAYERTQLAWIRTVLALITSGFAIDKAGEALHRARIEMGEALIKDAHFSGLLLSISGTIMMLVSAGIFFGRLKELDKRRGYDRKIPSPALVLSVVIIFFGAAVIYFLFEA
jgi:putative membrane protein